MLLGFLVCDGGQKAQRDRVPLLWEQQQQEAQADDASGCQTHHTEDHLVLQHIHGCSDEEEEDDEKMEPGSKTADEDGWKPKQIEINYRE